MLVAFSTMPPAKGFNLLVGGGAGGRSVLSAGRVRGGGSPARANPRGRAQGAGTPGSLLWRVVTNPVDSSIMGGSNLTPYDVVQLIGESPAYDVVVNNIGAGPDPSRQQRATRMVDPHRGHRQEPGQARGAGDFGHHSRGPGPVRGHPGAATSLHRKGIRHLPQHGPRLPRRQTLGGLPPLAGG